jgi:hypothetical protein
MYQTKPERWIGRPCEFTFQDGRVVPLPTHEKFMASRAKRQILVIHRRGRKTSMSLEKMFQYLATRPRTVGKTLAPVRKQAKEIIWDDPDMLFHPNVLNPKIIASINKADLSVRLTNGSVWSLDGADNPHSKRGGNVKVLHLTEAGDHDEALWTQVYEPVLIANHGVAIFEGNPRGRNWYYRLFEKAPEREGWDRFLVSATETPIFTEADLLDLQRNTPDAVYRAEYLCEWVDSIGTVFRDFDKVMVLSPTEPVAGRSYRSGLDLGKIQDYTVDTTIDRHTWDEVAIDRFNSVDWPTIKRRLKRKYARFGKKKNGNTIEVQIECNGIGDPIYDDFCMWAASNVADPDLKEGDGPDIIPTKDLSVIFIPFKTTNDSKAMLVSDLSLKMEGEMCRLIKDDVVKKELEEFTYKKTALNFIYSHPDGGHDDTVMSKMLAFWDIGYKFPLPEDKPKEKSSWGITPSQRSRFGRPTGGGNTPFGIY